MPAFMTVIRAGFYSTLFRYLLITLIVILFISILKQLSSNGESTSPIGHNDLLYQSTEDSFKINNFDINPNKSAKILCYILLSRRKVKTAKLIKETWGSHCDSILFFGGFEYPQLPVVYLNVSEGYENLWGKAKAALLYLSQHAEFKTFQYFIKADDDTFVIVENLRKFINFSQLSLDKPVWFGFKLKHRQIPQGYMSGGAGYVFNYKALEKVSKIFTRTTSLPINSNCNVNGEYGIEDLELGKCFLSAGVENVDTVDTSNNSERFLPLSYDTFVNGAISSYHWIWRQAWNRVKTGRKCCSKDLITMHEVSPSQMKFIYHLLYKTNIWKINLL